MNKARRKELDRAFGLIEEAAFILENVRDEEQEAFDNMPENGQQSERGQKMEAGIDQLQEAYDACDGIKANIEEAKE